LTAAKQELITSVEFKNLRIPYHADLADLGVDNVGWKVLQETIFPNATTLDSIVMALIYCKKRNLDIFKRPVHIVPMYSSAAKAMIDTVWPSISELRTTAARTGEYAGADETKFGEEIEETVGKVRIKFPRWAQVTVYRIVKGTRCAFVGPKTYWLESYASKKRDDATPNEMWCRRVHGQLEKCAEAAALRKAFPEEIGNEYCAEEMEGQRLITVDAIVEPPAPEPPAPPPPPPPPEDAPPPEPQNAPFTIQDAQAVLENFQYDLRGTENIDALDGIYSAHIEPHEDALESFGLLDDAVRALRMRKAEIEQ
jgi:phage recombination protein Bet